MKNVGVKLFLLFIFCLLSVSAMAEPLASDICGWRTYLAIMQPGEVCPDTAPDLTDVQLDSYGTNCYQDQSVGGDCINQYKVCCPNTTKMYEDAVTIKKTETAVPLGTEQDVALALYETAKTEILAPSCSVGYNKTADLLGYVSNIRSNADDYTKSDVTITAWGRIGCSKFTNSTTVALNPVQSGGGSTAEVDELKKVNTTLESIETMMREGLKFKNFSGIKFSNNTSAFSTFGNVTGFDRQMDEFMARAQGKCITYTGEGYWVYPPDKSSPPYYVPGQTTYDCLSLQVHDKALFGVMSSILSKTGKADFSNLSSILKKMTFGNMSSSNIKSVQYNYSSINAGSYRSNYFQSFASGIPTTDDYKGSFNTFVQDMKGTSLFGLINGFFNAPSSGSSSISFSGGVYGTHSFDFASWSSILQVIKALVLIIFSAMSMKIIFLKGGSG